MHKWKKIGIICGEAAEDALSVERADSSNTNKEQEMPTTTKKVAKKPVKAVAAKQAPVKKVCRCAKKTTPAKKACCCEKKVVAKKTTKKTTKKTAKK